MTGTGVKAQRISIVMTARELIEFWICHLESERSRLGQAGHDLPLAATPVRAVQRVGDLHCHEFLLSADVMLREDLPLSVVAPDEPDATEGSVLQRTGNKILVQLVEAIRGEPSTVTLVPDLVGLLQQTASRLSDIVGKPNLYDLGPAERVAALLQAEQSDAERYVSTSSVLTTIWEGDRDHRRQKLATIAMDLIRANKRVLLVSPDHQACDEVTAVIARTMKIGGLNYKTWISRYELPLSQQVGGIDLHPLGFEAQMHQFYAKSQADKASLRNKYDRFRELSPFLAQKEAKQRDLDEVRLLEWRQVTQLRDLQVKMADVVNTQKEFEQLPLLQRLTMQAVGKNADSLKQYGVLYQSQMDQLNHELDMTQQRIQELVPEAAVPRGMRAECEQLKEDITKLGGTKKVRELLAAQEDPNRQAFIQNRRLVTATPTKVASDPLFSRVRFDVLIVDEAPRMAAPALLAAAGLVRERIVVSGDFQDIAACGQWAMPQTASQT